MRFETPRVWCSMEFLEAVPNHHPLSSSWIQGTTFNILLGQVKLPFCVEVGFMNGVKKARRSRKGHLHI